MPHNEIANSPSTPVVMTEGPFAGQLAIGDVTYGGLQRVFTERSTASSRARCTG